LGRVDAAAGIDEPRSVSFVNLPYVCDALNTLQSFEPSNKVKLVGSVSRVVGLSLGSAPINPWLGTIENNQ